MIALIFLVLILPVFYKNYLLSQFQDDSEVDAQLLEDWKKEIELAMQEEEESIELEAFDPNQVSQSQWEQMGIKPYVSARIRKYLEKGGRFYKLDDVKRIYGINQDRVDELAPWMRFPGKKKSISSAFEVKKTVERESYDETYKAKEKETKRYELNLADTSQLKTIRGIGSFWSNKVVNYREALGGFVDRMQIYEIYYMKDSIADLIIDNTLFESKEVQQMNINAVNKETLSRHPYMDYKLANAIVKYREQHGAYKSLDDLKKIYILTAEDFERLQPYLKISD